MWLSASEDWSVLMRDDSESTASSYIGELSVGMSVVLMGETTRLLMRDIMSSARWR
jgi:hypothetical protein